ncbi:MAG: hypothetical protein ABI707_00965 [Ferruginibacter sp.]
MTLATSLATNEIVPAVLQRYLGVTMMASPTAIQVNEILFLNIFLYAV